MSFDQYIVSLAIEAVVGAVLIIGVGWWMYRVGYDNGRERGAREGYKLSSTFYARHPWANLTNRTP